MIGIVVTLNAEKVKLLLEKAPEELRAAIELGSAKLLSAMQQTAAGGLLFVNPPADTYALPMETGTRPHFPPTAALLPWVLKKFPGADEKKAKSFRSEEHTSELQSRLP